MHDRSRDPASRRTVLAATGAGLAAALAGCPGRGADLLGPDPLEGRDCEDASRPEPSLPDDAHEDAVEPAAYPEWPESTDEEAVLGYVEAYERAYRRNRLVTSADGQLVGQGLSLRRREASGHPGDGTTVRLQYTYWETLEREVGTVHGDSPTIVVSYYVDGEAVLRAAVTGHDADAPDPLAAGALLECRR